MKITIESYGSVYSTETEYDGLTADDLVAKFGRLMVSAGYSYKNVEDIFDIEI